MGERKISKFEPDFNQSVKIEFPDHRISSNKVVPLLREADFEITIIRRSLIKRSTQEIFGSISYQLDDLTRERVYAMGTGFSAQDDVDRLEHNPTSRIAVWNRSSDSMIDEYFVSQPTLSLLLTKMAAHRTNVNAQRDGLSQSVHRHIAATGNGKRARHATVDLDSHPIEVPGEQQAAITTVTIIALRTKRWLPASREIAL